LDKEKQKNGSSVPKLQKTLDKDEKKKTEKCDNEYKVSVSNLAQAQDKFYDNDMPMLLKEFEIHDEKRIGLTKEYFIELCNIQSPLGPQVTSSTERLLESFQKIDAKADINLYVDSNRPQGERPRATYEGGLSSPSSSTTTNNTAPPPVKVKKEKDETKKEKNKDKEKDKNVNNNDDTEPKEKPKKKPKEEKTTPPPPSDLPPPPPSNPPPPIPTNHNDTEPAKKDDQYIALYDYEANEPGEIDMEEGEIITLMEKDDESGWWVGKNQKGQVGSFPSNFVDPIEILEINKEYRAIFNYEAEDEGELNITEGDILFVFTETDGWYFGKNQNDEEGNFPSNYVELI